MNYLKLDNYIIKTPILTILYDLQKTLTNGKLREIRPGSDNIVVTCPHHSSGREKNADCNIYIGDSHTTQYGFARCFACDFQGSFAKFVGECFDASEAFGKKWLTTHYGELTASSLLLDDDICISKKLKKENSFMDKTVLERYSDWTPYLAQRGLTHDICREFQVKYDQHTREVIFPVFDEYDRLIMLPKRSIDTKRFYLDKEVEKPLYGLGRVIKNNIKKIIITEGPFDTLKANMFGFPAVGCFGTISDSQIKALNNSGVTSVYAMFDNDAAGERFASILQAKLKKSILLTVVKIPNGFKDIGELDYDTFWKVINSY